MQKSSHSPSFLLFSIRVHVPPRMTKKKLLFILCSHKDYLIQVVVEPNLLNDSITIRKGQLRDLGRVGGEGREKNGRMKLEFGIQGVLGLEGKHSSPLHSLIISFFFPWHPL